jgi:hypothetical protein
VEKMIDNNMIEVFKELYNKFSRGEIDNKQFEKEWQEKTDTQISSYEGL